MKIYIENHSFSISAGFQGMYGNGPRIYIAFSVSTWSVRPHQRKQPVASVNFNWLMVVDSLGNPAFTVVDNMCLRNLGRQTTVLLWNVRIPFWRGIATQMVEYPQSKCFGHNPTEVRDCAYLTHFCIYKRAKIKAFQAIQSSVLTRDEGTLWAVRVRGRNSIQGQGVLGRSDLNVGYSPYHVGCCQLTILAIEKPCNAGA